MLDVDAFLFYFISYAQLFIQTMNKKCASGPSFSF